MKPIYGSLLGMLAAVLLVEGLDIVLRPDDGAATLLGLVFGSVGANLGMWIATITER